MSNLHVFRSRTALMIAFIMLGFFASSCKDDVLAPEALKPIVSGPASIDFGDVPSDLCRDTVIRYDNLTGKDVTINSITFSDAAFSWTGIALPVQVKANSSIDVKVRYCPVTESTFESRMTVKGTGGDSVAVTLRGKGIEQSIVEAKAGSVYTMEESTLDSASGETTVITQTYRVVADDITLNGKTNVRQLMQDGQEGSLSFAYNADGSVAMLLGDLSEWLLLPTHGGAGNTVVVADTTIDYQGIPLRLVIDIATSYGGIEPITIQGKTYNGKRIIFTTTTTASALGQEETQSEESYLLWVSELGFYGRQERPAAGPNGEAGWSTETMIQHSIVK